MLINQVAQTTGLTISTIRYYEREGLLNDGHVIRQSNGYRVYNESAVERLRHFKQARTSGLTIAEIKQLANAHDTGKLTAKQKRIFLRDKINALDQKIAVLEEMRTGFKAELAAIQHQSSKK